MKNVSKFINRCFALNFTRVAMWTKNKFGFSTAVAEDIAARALVYTISPLLRGESANPATGEDWYHMAKGKARNLAIDEIKRRGHSLVTGSVDDVGEDDEGEVRCEHVWVERASYDRWRTERAARDRRAKGKVAMALLPKLFALMKTSRRDQLIFRAVELGAVPVKDVCAAFGVNPQQVYVICYRVAKGLRMYGPKLVEEAFAA